MICNRFKVWQDSFSLIVAASLIGCGSSSTPGTTTAVPPAQTTAVAPARPGMPANTPGGAGHMNPAHMQQMAQGGQSSSSGGSSASPGAPGSQNSQYMAQMAANMPQQNSSANGATGSPNMAAHMESSKMLAHTGSGGASSSNGAAMAAPPGMSAPAGMAPGGAGAPAAGHGAAPGMSSSGGANAQDAAAAQMRGANGQPSAMPGQPGSALPGQPGGAGSPAGNLTPGSIEDTLYRFCVAIADGDTAAAAEYVSPKAKGLIGQIRDGELSEEKLEEITDAISPVTELQPNPSQTVTKRSLRNRKNQVISFTVKKDKDEEYKITEFSISKPKKGAQGFQGGQGGRGGQGGQGSF